VVRQPVTGRLLVFLSQSQTAEPREGPNWYSPEPFLAIDVKDLKPGAAVRVGIEADAFPANFWDLPVRACRVQAALHLNPDVQNHAKGEGNLFSRISAIEFDPAAKASVPLQLDQVVREPAFPDRWWL